MQHFKHLSMVAALLILMVGLTPAAAQTKVTLVVWDNWTRDAEQTLMGQLDTQFKADHPGVTIQREGYTSADLAATLSRVLAQNAGPDVAMIPQNSLATLAKAGLLLPLDDAAVKYGWNSRYSPDLQARNIVGDKGYSMSVTAEMVAMFYNKSIFSQLSLTIPATWDDLEADLDTIKAGGIIPITFGNADGSAGIDTFGALAHAYSDINDITSLIKRNPGAAFLTEGNLSAAQDFSDWLDKGYFSPDFATMDNAAALAEFTSGKSAMWLASSDNSSAIMAALGDQAGFFLLPSPIGDSVAPTIGGLGAGYAIRATSPNIDLAAQYIDFMTNADAANALLGIGDLSAIRVDTSKLADGTLIADLAHAWTTITTAGRVGQRFDAVLPDIGRRIQTLTTHKLDPEAFVDQVEQDYEAGA